MTDFAPDELRALVREVLRDTLPGEVVNGARGAAGPEPRAVSLTSDAELAALVQAVARECEDPAARARLADGTVTFRLLTPVALAVAAESVLPATPTDSPASLEDADVLRVEHGVLTERHVKEAARSGVRLVAARGVVVTPLARDRARSAGVDIERER